MFISGFWELYKAGILKRAVYPDATIQKLINDGVLTSDITEKTLPALLDAAKPCLERLKLIEPRTLQEKMMRKLIVAGLTAEGHVQASQSKSAYLACLSFCRLSPIFTSFWGMRGMESK